MEPLLPILAEVNFQILVFENNDLWHSKINPTECSKNNLASFPPVQKAIIKYSGTRFLLKIIYRQIFVKSNFQKENR